MFHELKIDPEFKTIIKEMSEDEFRLLEEDIIEDGEITDPIIAWNGVIVDGHHRYKIAMNHPHIPFSVAEKEFECRDQAILWILKRQLGRRNLTLDDKRYLVGKQYETEKHLEAFIGNQHTLDNQSGVDRFCPPQKSHGTRTKIAKEHGVSEGYVEAATHYSQGVDAAEQVVPGMKKEIVSGNIDATVKEISDLRKLPEEERKIATELLKIPSNMRRFDPDNQATKQRLPIKKELENIKNEAENNEDKNIEKGKSQKEDTSFEDSLIVTYDGIITTFVASSNNLLVRFPILKSDPRYREQILERLQNATNYIIEAKRYLKNED